MPAQQNAVTHNPYAPPASAVEKPALGVHARPSAVAAAVALLVLAFLDSSVGTLFRFVRAFGLTNGQAIIVVVVLPFSIALMVWIIRAIWQGRNWARITLTVFLCLKLLVTFWFLPRMFRLSLGDNLIYLVNFALLASAVALQYTPAARAWFLGSRTSDYRSRKRLTATSGLGE